MRFGIKDDFIELQGFRRCEEQIKIFESLGQDKTLHFIDLLFAYHVGERSVTSLRAAIFNEIIEHCIANAPIFRVTSVMLKIISRLNDFGTQMITSGHHVHRFVIESFRLDAVQVPHLER
jgi:hypothetical protein